MKNKILLLVVLIVVIVIAVMVYFCSNRVKIEFTEEAEACFIYEGVSSVSRLNEEDVELLRTLFNGKFAYKDNPSCGFSEDVSVTFDNRHTFCIARDTCPIVYWKEKNKYIKLSEKEMSQLYELLGKYGFYFPCL